MGRKVQLAGRRGCYKTSLSLYPSSWPSPGRPWPGGGGDGQLPGSGDHTPDHTPSRQEFSACAGQFRVFPRVCVAGRLCSLGTFLQYSFYFGCHFPSAWQKDVFARVPSGPKYQPRGAFKGKMALVAKITKLYRLFSLFKL